MSSNFDDLELHTGIQQVFGDAHASSRCRMCGRAHRDGEKHFGSDFYSMQSMARSPGPRCPHCQQSLDQPFQRWQ